METQIAPATIDKIREITLASRQAIDDRTTLIHGEPFVLDARGEFVHVKPPGPERLLEPTAVQLSTLTSLVDWLTFEGDSAADKEDAGKLLVHVIEPQIVRVYGARRGPHHQRFHYATAAATDLAGSLIGKDQSQADFIVWLLTAFLRVDGDDRALIMKVIGNLTEEEVRTSVDDGVTNIVTIRSGVSFVVETNVPNVVRLHPRRSFAEIGPVPEEFAVRVTKGPSGPRINLRSADAGAWRIDVVAKVADWLREKLPKGTRVIA